MHTQSEVNLLGLRHHRSTKTKALVEPESEPNLRYSRNASATGADVLLMCAEVAGHRPGAQWEADTTLHNHSIESQCQSQNFPLRLKLVRIPFLEDESPTQRHYQSALTSGIQYAQCSYMIPTVHSF